MLNRSHLPRHHGRLVKRFKRQASKARLHRNGKLVSERQARKMAATIGELMMVERLMLMSDLEFAALARDPDRMDELLPPPTRDEIQQRIMLMRPGAGLEIPR